MADSFVDVTYRGLEVGKRVKLRDVRAEVGYLEVPLPMPVGTRVSLDAGDGLHIEAFVTSVHEQVAGSELVPGMKVRPTLAGKAATWWQSRVDAAASAAEAEADAKAAEAARKIAEQSARAEAEAKAKAEAEAAKVAADVAAEAEAKAKAEAEAARAAVPAEMVPEESGKKRNGKRNGKRARSESGAHDAVEATPAQGSGRATMVMSADAVKAALAAEGISTDDGIVDDGKRTEAMAAVDPEVIAAAEREAAATPFPSPPAEEGKRTVMMDAIDISMITGEPTTDIGVGAASGDDDDVEMTIEADEGEEPSPSASGKLPSAGDKQRKSGKRRKKR